MKFSDLVGQEAAVRRIQETVESGRIPHAFLFHGQRGVGKTTAALALARRLQCLSPEGGAACERCPSCHKSLNFNHPDIFLIPPTPSSPDSQAGEAQRTDFVSSTLSAFRKDPIFLLDETRPLEHRIRTMRAIKHEASRAVVDGPWKIVILKRAGAMNTESANAMLKLLEEPNPNTLLILGMERPAELPDTIRSRCALVRFRDLSPDEIATLLVQKLGAEPATARLAAGISGGSLTRAAALLDENIEELVQEAMELARFVNEDPARHEKLENWIRSRDRARLTLLFDILMNLYRDLLRASVEAREDGVPTSAPAGELSAWASRLGPHGITDSIRKIEEARTAVDGYGYLPLVLYSLFEQMPRGAAASVPPSRVHRS